MSTGLTASMRPQSPAKQRWNEISVAFVEMRAFHRLNGSADNNNG